MEGGRGYNQLTDILSNANDCDKYNHESCSVLVVQLVDKINAISAVGSME